MNYIDLRKDELIEIEALISDIKLRYKVADSISFLENARFYATRLPLRIQKLYDEMTTDHEHNGITLVRGFLFDQDKNTPKSWQYEKSDKPELDIDFFAVLLSSCVGHCFGWSTQQSGKIIHDLIPQKNKGQAQTGYGSTSELLLHTEDSFHEFRAEYICMFGIKNIDSIATTVASVRDLHLDDDISNVLYNQAFELLPDESHLDAEQLSGDTENAMENEASTMFTFYGDRNFPFICYDPAYTDLSNASDAQKEALDVLQTEIGRKIFDISIRAGDVCIIDNRKVVHGRKAFTPKFDGSDRWLKRVSITTNLRKSAEHRKDTRTRVLGL